MQALTLKNGAHAGVGNVVVGGGWRVRVVPAALCLLAGMMLVVAAALDPDARGLGTHEQFGLPACGTMQATGLPCPTCGMTTAFAYAADGDLAAAFVTQPVGALLALLAAVTVLVAGYAAIVGLSPMPMLRAVWRPSVLIVMGLIVILAWVYKLIVVTGGA